MERRDFLKVAALSGAAIAVPGIDAVAGRRGSVGQEPDMQDKPVTDFKFRPDGKFKILQFTDTHYVSGDKRSERAMANVLQMLDVEKPDLVIHTGDIIFGNPAEKSARESLQPIADRGIPFAVTLGNHDSDFELSRAEIYDVIRSVPGNLNTPARDGLYGFSNDVITLSSAKGVERVFYLFDSGSYIDYRGEKGYDYIRHSQIGWYREHSEAFTKSNGGSPIPSMAFFHIAVREFTDGIRSDSRDIVGTSCENPCPSNYNSGLVANFKEMGDVEAVVCGHDHDNDYVMKYGDMFYIFGRFSGCDTVYNNVGPSGARIFEFTEGEEGFRTYIRKYGSDLEQDLSLHRGMSHLSGEKKKY